MGTENKNKNNKIQINEQNRFATVQCVVCIKTIEKHPKLLFYIKKNIFFSILVFLIADFQHAVSMSVMQ